MIRPRTQYRIPEPARLDTNALALMGQALYQPPVCVLATGDPGTLTNGAPGALSTVTWTRSTDSIYDAFDMIGDTPTTDIRIPLDGFYDIYCNAHTDDVPAANEELEFRWENADTSNTGFGAPAWTQVGPRFTKTFFSTKSLDSNLEFLLRGVELHANDMLRCRARVNGGTSFTQTTITYFEMRYSYPIPSFKPKR